MGDDSLRNNSEMDVLGDRRMSSINPSLPQEVSDWGKEGTRVSFVLAEEVTGDVNNVSSSSVNFVVWTWMGLVGEVGRWGAGNGEELSESER